ncbi:hypothetical protein FHX49_000531 [Microbacterium endophyticum]|uniref:Integrase catalytic domain-containing protein n=1 Tax=Microbacterium endophyticum TaxID=1526412 RepID=A0A7W4V2A1_9MICO|nr:transposase family protein [Microbacterium endophyticum]MBB2974990.1 hypothetical protein [Microbacterium endophyticum]NIK37287.1 hypothetical protein [Microbacterium endophyticum]
MPSASKIRRVLNTAGLIGPEPRWRLADGQDVEILNWLDDHSRYLLSCAAHTPVAGDDVVQQFLETAEIYGIPASMLTDSGRVFTDRRGGAETRGQTRVAAKPTRARPSI